MFNPEMLILARDSRGMSQGELAEAVGISQGKLSKYENGMLEVSENDIDSLGRKLGYSREFFDLREAIYGLGSSFLFNRKRESAPIGVQRRIQAQINVLRMQVQRLLRGAELQHENEFPRVDIDEHDGSPESVAATVRAFWRMPLGPVRNVIGIIEKAGGVVMKCNFGTKTVDAAHLWVPTLPPLFFVNDSIPGDRLRFTMAHEIGHAVMHSRALSEDIEDEANRFAAEFLMPAVEMRQRLVNLTLKDAATLKIEWKVSMAAIIKRAFDLECISPRHYRTLFTQLSTMGYRTTEPYPIASEEPTVLRKLVTLHKTELGYSLPDLAKLLFVDELELVKPHTPMTIVGETKRVFCVIDDVENQSNFGTS